MIPFPKPSFVLTFSAFLRELWTNLGFQGIERGLKQPYGGLGDNETTPRASRRLVRPRLCRNLRPWTPPLERRNRKPISIGERVVASALVERLRLRAGLNDLDHSTANDLSFETDVNEMSAEHLGPKDDWDENGPYEV